MCTWYHIGMRNIPAQKAFVSISTALLIALLGIFPSWSAVENSGPQETGLNQDLYFIDIVGREGLSESAGEQLIKDTLVRVQAMAAKQEIKIDYPIQNSIFPPNMVAPTFIFHDPETTSSLWLVDITSSADSFHIYILTDGRLPEDKIDPRCSEEGPIYQDPEYRATAKAWSPTEKIWMLLQEKQEESIKVTIQGIIPQADGKAEPSASGSKGMVNLTISSDPVNAPIFFRDVPLMPSRNDEGVIKPLAPNAIPLIEWRLRDLSKHESTVVMKALPTCGNCHSFSKDGSTLGMDMDGPSGDKGAYAVVPVSKNMVINTENVFSWNDYNKDKVTFGLFSRVSPDGRTIISAVDEMVFVANYMEYGFLQTFYPTQGILAVYTRSTGEIKTLPGADDSNFVHANAVWSPDGNTIAFLKAPAKEPFRLGIPLSKKANDPNETQIKYDIYTIPFNDGRGGTATPLTGASFNGKSNSFPKYSPDGRWIVYVQANNGLLMRPDSELYILPAAGGKARRMNCNTTLMNSWHSWSPNSRWLVFSSKSNKPYTEMFLTHIDENGNDSPAILVPNATPANRAVNIPEFANIAGDGIADIQTPAVDYRRFFDRAEELIEQEKWDEAFTEFQKSLDLKPNFQLTLDGLGYIAAEKGDLDEAKQYFEKSLALDPVNVFAHIGLGVVALKQGDSDTAEKSFQEAVRINPMNSQALFHFGNILATQSNYTQAIQHYEKALEIDPNHLETHFNLGMALNSTEKFSQAIPHFEYILTRAPRDAKTLHLLAVAVNREGDIVRATRLYDQVLEIQPDDLPTLNNLAWILATAPKAEQRDGARAVQLAVKLCEATQYKILVSIDTLSAAYAQDGQFELAVKWAAHALEMSDPADPKYPMRSELRLLYSQKRVYPYR